MACHASDPMNTARTPSWTLQLTAPAKALPLPMVVEAHSGAWGPAAAKVWLKLGKAIALVSGESTSVEALRARQNLGLTLHRETARAILRRSPVCVESEGIDAAQALLYSENTQ